MVLGRLVATGSTCERAGVCLVWAALFPWGGDVSKPCQPLPSAPSRAHGRDSVTRNAARIRVSSV